MYTNDKEERLLTESESIIMLAIWDFDQDIAVQKLIEHLAIKYHKDYARTTVVTFLLRLSDKKFVKTYRRGKTSYVHADKNIDEYRILLTKKLLKEWYKGDVDALIKDVEHDTNYNIW